MWRACFGIKYPLYCRRIGPNSITATLDYRAKVIAMYSSAKAADEFFETHMNLRFEAADRYISMLMLDFLLYWEDIG